MFKKEMQTCYIPPLFYWCIVRMLLFLFCFIFFAIPFVVSSFQLSNRPHPRLSNASDQEALLGFMSAITHDPLHLASDWKRNVSFCDWTGITCSRRRQRVVSLDVSSMGLQGTISPFLGNLSFLRILNLANNSFHAQIPHQLGSLFRLKMLRLSRNQLQGSIPSTLARCRSLQNLTLNVNNLAGNIPLELCVLHKLQFFHLAANYLTGTIPVCLGNISSLQYLLLNENNFHGSVPSELGMLRHVILINLHINHLTGEIPSSFSNCTNLLSLDLSLNQLRGHITPLEFCSKSTGLKELALGGNQLSGSIPATLSNCTNLQEIELWSNQLSGVLPMEFSKLTQLQVLSLLENQLVSSSITSFSILTALTNCSILRVLDLSSNQFTGRLPFSIGRLSAKLYFLGLASNHLTGEIPPHIGNLTNLTSLVLEFSYFTGIPSSLSRLQKLQRLYLRFNNLQGNIPIEIGQLKSLGLLDLGQNNLSGRIPDSIAHLQQLRYLYLNQNQLSSTIPANLGKCVNLLLLDLSYNKLSGHIPPQAAGFANLAFYFNLSNNLLHGPMPSELSKMIMLQAIDISVNQFTGYIPSALRSCKEVEYLNLSCNALEGPIPVSFSELLSLQEMDFSSNNLSGEIPMSLENLKMLHHLNFSFNKLSGEVPKGGVFKKLGAAAFIGNLGLCGPWVSLPPCSASKHNSGGHMKRVIIVVIAITTIVVVSCLLLGILWRRNHKKHIVSRASLNVGHRRISYGELILATNEFSDANLLGVGSFGKVYKGVLNDGTSIAVKLLDVQNEGAHKSFNRECKVLGRVRHRNLIRIITSYSDLQVKALIFPLMSNGSLEKWLYPDGEDQSSLSLIQRLNIAIDIAEGLVYLHHHCFVQVIHCDLKPNNVLLGEDMTAYIIDFGIATICFANSEDSALTSTHALKGSAGYIPPEYGFGGHVTTKGDVYSYGIMLLQMITRKRPTDNMFEEGMNLPKWVGSTFPNQVGNVVDTSLLRIMSNMSIEEDKDLNCLRELISVGLLCTKESPEGRPTMIDIVGALKNMRETFLGVTGIPKFQSDITYLLGNSSTTHNNTDQTQSSSTF